MGESTAKTVFHRFDKETLIAFIQQEGYGFRYTNKAHLEQELRRLEWMRKAYEAQAAMDKAVKDMNEADTSTPEGHKMWYEAQLAFSKALEASQKADKKYKI